MSTQQPDGPAEVDGAAGPDGAAGSPNAARRMLQSAARVVVARPEHRMPLDQAEQALFLDSGDRAYKYQRFGLLLVLASVIATGGIVLDSTATVVGAMIVAPLGVPIMGVALALAVGHGARLRGAILAVLGGAVVCLLVGVVMSPLLGQGDPLDNPQIEGRTVPGLTDLVVAVATGIVAAVAVIRKDLSDVLPGVAIAISLVPPLCVAGLLLSRGDLWEAVGALTLFLTNVLAMVLAGVAIFALVGYHRTATMRRKTDVDQRRAVAVIMLALVVVVTPLVLHTTSAFQEVRARIDTEEAAQTWVAGSGWTLIGVDFRRDQTTVQIIGTADLPDTQQLLDLMATGEARSVPVVVDASVGVVIDSGLGTPDE